jgi:hypothetical protein
VIEAQPERQLSLSDPDARAMATSGGARGTVGYNVQIVLEAVHHLIVAQAVTNVGHDRGQLTEMAGAAKEAMGAETLEGLAFEGLDVTPRAQAADLGSQGRRSLRHGLRALGAGVAPIPPPRCQSARAPLDLRRRLFKTEAGHRSRRLSRASRLRDMLILQGG